MKIEKTFELESESLRLRAPSKWDIQFIFSASRFPGFTDGMLWDPPTSIDELIQPFNNSIDAWENGTGYAFTIIDKSSGRFLGKISIRKTENPNCWNTGFWTHPKEQGKGIMSKSLALILEFGFTKLNAEKIEAYHAIWNIASEKVLKKNGFRFLKYLEQGFRKNGNWVSENLLEISKDDWLVQRSR